MDSKQDGTLSEAQPEPSSLYWRPAPVPPPKQYSDSQTLVSFLSAQYGRGSKVVYLQDMESELEALVTRTGDPEVQNFLDSLRTHQALTIWIR